MSAMKESIKLDLRKDPDELEHEADRARADVEQDLEALERRFSPGEMLDQVLQVVRRNGGDFGHNLAAQVRSNPLPVLLTGAGITWLITSSARGSQSSRMGERMGQAMGESPGSSIGDRTGGSMGERMSSAGSSMGSRVSSTGAAIGERVSSAGDAARSAAEGARGAMHGAAEKVRGTGERLTHASRAGVEGMREGYAYLSHEQPLILGAIAVAAGAIIGAMLPSSEAEDRLLGEASDDATERLKEEGRRTAETAKSMASPSDTGESSRPGTRSKTTVTVSTAPAGTPPPRG